MKLKFLDLESWVCLMFFLVATGSPVRGGPGLEYLGLDDMEITSMGIWGSVIAVGTAGDGVFYQNLDDLPDSGWVSLGLQGKNVTAVYPHSEGPAGWGIAAGVSPEGGDSVYVYCSVDGGEFVPNTAGISDSLAGGVFSLAGFPNVDICGEKYAATGGALYRQLWGDSVWTPVYRKEGIEGEGVTRVVTRENAAGLVLAGGSAGVTGILLVKSLDFGDTWVPLDPPGPALAFDFDVNASSSDLQTVFVSHGSEISRSLNGGESWEVVFEGSYMIYDVLYEPLTGMVVAGGIMVPQIEPEAVLLSSTDLGETWSFVILQGLERIISVGLPLDGYVYFASPFSGVYRFPVEDLSVSGGFLPSTFTLRDPFPNPFNPGVTIEFSLPAAADVRLTVTDLLGREVEILFQGPAGAGTHTVRWVPHGIPSGIYLVTLTLDDSGVNPGKPLTQVRKITIMK